MSSGITPNSNRANASSGGNRREKFMSKGKGLSREARKKRLDDLKPVATAIARKTLERCRMLIAADPTPWNLLEKGSNKQLRKQVMNIANHPAYGIVKGGRVTKSDRQEIVARAAEIIVGDKLLVAVPYADNPGQVAIRVSAWGEMFLNNTPLRVIRAHRARDQSERDKSKNALSDVVSIFGLKAAKVGRPSVGKSSTSIQEEKVGA